ncbi:TonB-dependent receptor [Flavobacterium turcicum]|uniref:TonB-dependent receptor n=1 Tax=Flavobacterium turcicum TaxID=2764718 RepID=A0ABR7JDQ5_9FLAO|nr:TonB-dependent receptor [Flavobacterium turcicum]MBC5862299.1 TonB-dependent receptor [Flavobacterium turcicum]NHL01030.1 TonB-dependent receptor [Flavobacterium turcicum]
MKTLFFKNDQVPMVERQTKLMRVFFTLLAFYTSLFTFAQVKDTTNVNKLDAVLVSAVRVTTKTPVSFSNLTKKEIKFRNLGQDIPILMNYLPSVVTTSDAGNGVGYTGIRVRGSDATRVNVTINGIPYNDSESHGTYWVNMPDFASSVESLQLQRGVGTSTNGAGAFGASLNMLTDNFATKSTGEISNSFGSFNTRKHTVKFSTGLMNDHFEIAGRLSALNSDGFIDRGASDLKSYFLQGTYVGKTTLIKALVFGGNEKTYQSWNGIDGETLNANRRFNTAGAFTDEQGNMRFYDNETDNYQQDHSQLHWNEKFSDKWSTNFALHYTKGKGYYENYKEDADFAEYGLQPFGTVTTTDLVRQKWLDNDFYGTTFSANYKDESVDVIFGGGWNKYEGNHFGEVIWARFASQSELGDKYYDDDAIKTDGNIFAKANYQITSQLSLFGDLQFRSVNYKADGVQALPVNDTFNFFNPKAGLTYTVNASNALYASYARANREPNRSDYVGGNVRPEKLNDFELGWRYTAEKTQINTNVYYMAYKDQLILTGNLDDVGAPIRSNSEKSYRLGLEVDATIAFNEQWIIRPNFTLSANKNRDLAVEGQNYGTTDIAYSPSIIAGNIIVFSPIKNLHLSWLQKFVGEQYMNNIELPAARLADYFVNDLNVAYTFKPKTIFNEIVLTGLLNNFLDKKYVSNGYMYDIYPYYYPQAGTNFLLGLTLKF